jgi:N-acetyl-anhydromuramyl-L-alanine amidase AmpD
LVQIERLEDRCLLSTLSINDVTLSEGNAGTTNAVFTITLTRTDQQEVTVVVTSGNGTASDTADYIAFPPTTLTFTQGEMSPFAPGQTILPVTVAVSGDTVHEADETFFVNLSAPTNALIADDQGLGTIQDDDPEVPVFPTVSIAATTQAAETGPVSGQFTVTLNSASVGITTVSYMMTGTASDAGGDYTTLSGTVDIADGQTTAVINVTGIVDDTISDPNETVIVTMNSATNGVVIAATPNNTATVTIADNDPTQGDTAALEAVDFPEATWIPGVPTTNFNSASRTSADIRWVVIHTTEGTWDSAVNRFKDETQQVSAHYLVRLDGTIIQLVRDKDIAFHAGNYEYNQASIGIEHERYGTSNWTEAQFNSSKGLVTWLANQYAVNVVFPDGVAPAAPATGLGIIGHDQVPDPNNPSVGGGISHHTDPVNWDWAHYKSLFPSNETTGTPSSRLFRIYQQNSDFHFFTNSLSEFNAVVAQGNTGEATGKEGFGVVLTQLSGTAALHRIYVPSTGAHYYTFNDAERDTLVASGGGGSFIAEPDMGFIYTAQTAGTIEVFRLYNIPRGVHLFTDSVSEKDAILAAYGPSGNLAPGAWRQESSLGFAVHQGVGTFTTGGATQAAARRAAALQAAEHLDNISRNTSGGFSQLGSLLNTVSVDSSSTVVSLLSGQQPTFATPTTASQLGSLRQESRLPSLSNSVTGVPADSDLDNFWGNVGVGDQSDSFWHLLN